VTTIRHDAPGFGPLNVIESVITSKMPPEVAQAYLLDLFEQARFWRLVHVGAVEECWPFAAPGGATTRYPFFKLRGRAIHAHRVAFMLMNRREPVPGLFLLHSKQDGSPCDTTKCCNPFHLREGTAKENAGDMMRHGRARGGRRARTADRDGSPGQSA
jgi:hypothetical protein